MNKAIKSFKIYPLSNSMAPYTVNTWVQVATYCTHGGGGSDTGESDIGEGEGPFLLYTIHQNENIDDHRILSRGCGTVCLGGGLTQGRVTQGREKD